MLKDVNKRLTWVGIASSPRYYVSHEPIFKNMVLIFVSPFLTLLHWKTNTIVIPHHKVNGPCFIFSLDIFPWSFSPRIINFTYTFLITTFCLRLGICIWGLLASWIRQGCPTSSGYASSWLWLLIDTMKNTKDIHLNVALPENPVPGLGQEQKYSYVKPHFPNTMYLLYIVLGKWGIVHKGVYFTTNHIKRVHIRCRCTFYW